MISGLTKNYYIISSMEKISSIHWFVLEIADFRVPEPKRSQLYLTMCIPKVTFSWYHVWTCEKSAQFIHLFICLLTRVVTSTSDDKHPNIFLWTFNFRYKHVKKIDYFITLFQRYTWFEILESDWPTPFWPYMTEKQTNRFTDFTFG